MDPYRVLGLPPTATKEEVKNAFRKMALLHHPDLHAASSEAVKKQAEATFKSLIEAYQTIVDGNYRYRQSSSPGRAGFRRGSTSYASSSDSFYRHATKRGSAGGPFTFNSRHFVRTFVESGSMIITATLAGLMIAGILAVEPILGSLWDQRNRGKLFKDIELEVLERQMAQKMERPIEIKRKHVVTSSGPIPNGAGFAAGGVGRELTSSDYDSD